MLVKSAAKCSFSRLTWHSEWRADNHNGVRARDMYFIIFARTGVPHRRSILFYCALGAGVFSQQVQPMHEREELHIIWEQTWVGLPSGDACYGFPFSRRHFYKNAHLRPRLCALCVCGKWWAKWKTDCCATALLFALFTLRLHTHRAAWALIL